MQDAPGLSVLGGIDLAPKQEFADSVANPGQVDSEVLSAADQIAQLLLLGLRDADQAKLAGAQQTGQPDRITLVDFDVVGGVLQDVAGRADHDVETSLTSSSDQSIASRPRPRTRLGTAARGWTATPPLRQVGLQSSAR